MIWCSVKCDTWQDSHFPASWQNGAHGPPLILQVAILKSKLPQSWLMMKFQVKTQWHSLYRLGTPRVMLIYNCPNQGSQPGVWPKHGVQSSSRNWVFPRSMNTPSWLSVWVGSYFPIDYSHVSIKESMLHCRACSVLQVLRCLITAKKSSGVFDTDSILGTINSPSPSVAKSEFLR